MTPFETALSSARDASRVYSVAFSTSPAAAASRALRIAVFREDLTALLRSRAFSLVLIRLIWDLMFATNEPLQVLARGRTGPGPMIFLGVRLVPERAGDTAAQATSRPPGHPNRSPRGLRPTSRTGPNRTAPPTR